MPDTLHEIFILFNVQKCVIMKYKGSCQSASEHVPLMLLIIGLEPGDFHLKMQHIVYASASGCNSFDSQTNMSISLLHSRLDNLELIIRLNVREKNVQKYTVQISVRYLSCFLIKTAIIVRLIRETFY